MPNIINAEHNSSQTLTISLATLGNSVGRQSDMINNEDIGQMVRIFYSITTGTSPTAGGTIDFYLLSGNLAGTPIRTDNAGASDAGITIVNAPRVDSAQIDGTSDKTYKGSFLVRNPGPEFGIAIVNNTGVSLNATPSNHEVTYTIENVEIQ